MTASAAKEQPVNLILSGPAGGVIGAAGLSSLIGIPNLITIDMGGTSLDASLIVEGQPVLYRGAEFEELPINTPSLYIHTIGAGGGSIAWLDDAGALQVGPQSAGASPGPASYGRGGTVPTFTDAALVLGYLGSETPLGGTLVLDRDRAETAMKPIADSLGIGLRAAAQGVVRISGTKIMGAVRAITVELGRDPKDFSLLSFGGGGGLVAVDVAKELEIPTVVVPPGQGAFSALGMLMADVQHDFARTAVQPLTGLKNSDMETVYEEMRREALDLLDSEGFGHDRREIVRTVDVRYRGQEHSVTVTYPDDVADVASAIATEFGRLHERQYGHTMDDPLEVTTFRLRATGIVEKPSLPTLESRGVGGRPHSLSTRNVYVSEEEPAVEYTVYTREDLRAGDEVSGPAVIAEHTATTVLHRDDYLRVGDYGELIISVGVKN